MPDIFPQHIVTDQLQTDSAQAISDSIAAVESSSVYLRKADSTYTLYNFQVNSDSLFSQNYRLSTPDSLHNSLQSQYGFDGIPLQISTEKTMTVQSVLLISVLLSTTAFGLGYRYFKQMILNIYKVNKRLDFSFDNSFVGFELKAILTLQALLLESMVGLVLVQGIFYPESQKMHLLTGIGYFAIVFGVYHLFRLFIISIFGSVFGDSRSLRTYVSEYFSFVSLWGALLLPVTILLLFFHLPPLFVAIFLTLPAVVGRLLYIGKGVKIFLVPKRSIFYIILYLCALEIVPLIALFQVLIFAYSVT
ncbi:MAG: DUF4271 domain-containing protein [Bacteroidales bacterium]